MLWLPLLLCRGDRQENICRKNKTVRPIKYDGMNIDAGILALREKFHKRWVVPVLSFL